MSCCFDLLFWFLFVIVLLLACFKAYLVYTCGHYQIKQNLSDKVILITGCTAGIGKEAAFMLAKSGAKLYLACRNLTLANTFAAELRSQTLNNRISVLHCDLSDFASVRKCASAFLKTGDPLHVLINNAGLGNFTNNKISRVANGLEETMCANHFGHFLLTNLLLDKLKESAPARIVVVSSRAHLRGKIDLKNLNYEPDSTYPGGRQAYSDSKLANILFARCLSRRLTGSGVTVNSLHPGVVQTEFVRNAPKVFTPLIKLLFLFAKSSKEGAETVTYAAVAEELEDVSGQYFVENKPAATCLSAVDDKLAEGFWKASEKIVADR